MFVESDSSQAQAAVAAGHGLTGAGAEQSVPRAMGTPVRGSGEGVVPSSPALMDSSRVTMSAGAQVQMERLGGLREEHWQAFWQKCQLQREGFCVGDYIDLPHQTAINHLLFVAKRPGDVIDFRTVSWQTLRRLVGELRAEKVVVGNPLKLGKHLLDKLD